VLRCDDVHQVNFFGAEVFRQFHRAAHRFHRVYGKVDWGENFLDILNHQSLPVPWTDSGITMGFAASANPRRFVPLSRQIATSVGARARSLLEERIAYEGN